MSIESQIQKEIEKQGRGWIFFPADFSTIGQHKAVSKALERLTDNGQIIRLTREIYYYDNITSNVPPISLTNGSSSNLVQTILILKELPFVLTAQIPPCHTFLFSCFLICLHDPLQLHYSKGI